MGNAEGSLDLEKRLFVMTVERKKKAHGFQVRFKGYRTWTINMPYNGDLGREVGLKLWYGTGLLESSPLGVKMLEKIFRLRISI